jgi:hypothetical protein
MKETDDRLTETLAQSEPGQIESALAKLGIVLESVLPANQLVRDLGKNLLQQAEIDQFPPNSAKEKKLKPLSPGVPGFPGNPQAPGVPGTPGMPGFPGGESHADIKVFVCRKKKCDFVILHRKIVIPAGDSVNVRWDNRWCKVIVEAQLGIVIVRAGRKDLYIRDADGTAIVQSLNPPCPAD